MFGSVRRLVQVLGDPLYHKNTSPRQFYSYFSTRAVSLKSIPSRVPFDVKNYSGDPETSDVPETNTHFSWKSDTPKNILIIKKQRDPHTTKWLNNIASWVTETHKALVLVEPEAAADSQYVHTYDESEKSQLNNTVDLIITLGGDGTLLHAASLFSQIPSTSLPPPPVLSFHLGTLGVLMPFDIEDYCEVITQVLKGGFLCTPRLRLIADIFRLQGGTATRVEGHEILNEITLHRTEHPLATTIHCTVNGHSLATVVGDGLIVATATGSTAYSMWCGGPMIHPALGGMLLTPISPRGIARPALLPENAVLRLSVAPTGRATASVSFDGSAAMHLGHGDAVRVRKSPHPLYTVARTSTTADWVKGNYKLQMRYGSLGILAKVTSDPNSID
jgi:NAD kinase